MSYSPIDSLLSQEIALSESDSEFLVKDKTTLVTFSSIAAEINTEEVSTTTVAQIELSIDLQQDLPSSLFNFSSQLSSQSIAPFSYQPIFSAEQVDKQAAHDEEKEPDHFDPYPISDADSIAAGTITDNANPSTPTILSNFDLSNVFKLHSNPNAKHTIYLDFTGHTTENTGWNNINRPTIISPAYDTNGDASTFSNTEISEMVEIWQRVAEDFAPFEVNVTTEAPNIEDLQKSGAGDTRWGIRNIMTQDINAVDNTVLFGAGGIAYINSFNSSSDTPVFSFNKGVNNAAMTASHEIGHSLGLLHDGQIDSNPNDNINDAKSYHSGFGSGSTSWGTIMGSPFGKNLTQWSKGDYQYADNQQDDLAVITTNNGFGYRVDDYGDNLNTATRLSADASNKISTFGLIERNTDKDVFSFVTGTGSVLLNLNVAAASRSYISDANSNFNVQYLNTQSTNLDLWAGIYSSDGTLVAQSNPTDLLSANFTNLLLTTGVYYIQIDGVGKDGTDGYSDYGSLGQYSINSTLTSVSEVNGDSSNNTLYGSSNSDYIQGFAGDDILRDNLGDDILIGGDGDDNLYAGQGNDILQGGNGNDLYYLSYESTDLTNDTISGETAGGGTDTAYAIFAVAALADNVENLTLVGTANISGTGNSANNFISGNTGNNTLTGGAGDDLLRDTLGADTLIGGDGNDNLYAGQGNDILQGGNGNDLYYLSYESTDLTNDAISGETAGGGTDTAYAIFSVAALASNVENLTLGGTANINATGNSSNNFISGNTGNNSLSGGAGDDSLAGDAGDDLLRDNLGDDTLMGGDGDDNLYAGQGNDILQGGNGNDLYYLSYESTDLTNDVISGETIGGGTDTAYAIFSVAALADNVENLILGGTGNINATGNSSNNAISGNSGNNSLFGGAGNDSLTGGAGDDSLAGDAGDDLLRDNLGDDILIGGDGDDNLYAGQGNDILQGGNGNDLYYLSYESTDLTNDAISGETASGGTDTAYAIFSVDALADNVENLILGGSENINATGNSSNNAIYGNTGNNSLAGGAGDDLLRDNLGADTLIGGEGDDNLYAGQGNDILQGGNGNDLYYLSYESTDLTNDAISGETADGGTDTAYAIFSVDALADNVENLILAGTANLYAIGNSANNAIYGNTGNNFLVGGAGDDSLSGGDGNDTYLFNTDVAQGNDAINEVTSAGVDSIVFSGVQAVNIDLSVTIAQTVNSNLVLTVLNLENVTGGTGNDTIAGNSQNNIFNGGSGNDTFVFGSVGMTTLTQLGIDSIADFTVGQDKIQLSESIFHIPTVGINNFIAVADDAAAANATAAIVYSKGTGNLFYNSSIAAGVQFAQLSTGLALSQNDFLVSAATVV
jgi:Ca2+-binding RTX toxin-like protein